MALPKEPRQKMINMMYLVLTALLALNVSAEILNAFRTVNHSLANANNIIEAKNQSLFKSFEQKMNDPKSADRAKIWNAKATQAKTYADNLYNYIETIKGDLMKASGQLTPGGEYKEDNIDAPSRLLVEGSKGKELLAKLTEYKANLLSIDPEIKNEFQNTLPIDLSTPKVQNHGNAGDWSSAYFRMTPTIASITMLSKFQNDVKNSEAQVIDFCHRKVGEVVLVYDEFQAFAGTNSQYLMPGQELVITAGIGAFSKKAQPSVNVDGANAPLNAQGVAEYKSVVGGPGSYTKTVKISFLKPDGTPGVAEKKIDYTVGSPTGAFVSAEKVKVLYIGLPNELAVSGGNVGDEKVSVSSSNGGLRKVAPGRWISEPSNVGEATITVNAEGKSTAFKFRVKNVPAPIGMIGQFEGGRAPANAIKGQVGVRADLRDFVFEGVKFDITGFTLYATGAGFPDQPGISPNPGAYFNADSKRILERCRPGTTLVIDEIKAVGPGGSKKLQPLVFNLY